MLATSKQVQNSHVELPASALPPSQPMPPLYAGGVALELSPDRIGWLRDSSPLLTKNDDATLRERMASDGYLFLRGYLNREDVLAARREITNRMARDGQLAAGTDPMLALPAADYAKRFSPDLARDNAPLHKVLYAGPMIKFFRRFLGGPVLHFDYTWFRSIGPGKGTPSHCDSVYMGRGTENLYTAWTPIGDVSLQTGGLMILEGSINHQRLRKTYCKSDVDSFCVNRKGRAGEDAWSKTAGALTKNPAQLAKVLGGRWLTAEYRAGDVLIFSIFTVHGSLDNRSNVIRLSSDSRYQPAGEAADERWIGEKPVGHSAAGKRGRIC